MKLCNNKGQSLIEACLVTPTVLLVFCGVIFLSFRGFLYYYVDSQLYEAMICTEHSSTTSCERQLKKKIHSILIWGKLETISLQRNSFEIKSLLRLRFGEKTLWSVPALELRKHISLPLK